MIWIKCEKMMINVRPQKKAVRSKIPCCAWAYDIAYAENSNVQRCFSGCIYGCIIINTILLSLQHLGNPIWLNFLVESVSTVFTIVFLVEAAIKLVAVGRDYFSDPWNVFDFLICAISVVSMVSVAAEDQTDEAMDKSMLIMLLRFARVGRVIRIIKSWHSAKVLFNTLTYGKSVRVRDSVRDSVSCQDCRL